jgi:hypothetical protein
LIKCRAILNKICRNQVIHPAVEKKVRHTPSHLSFISLLDQSSGYCYNELPSLMLLGDFYCSELILVPASWGRAYLKYCNVKYVITRHLKPESSTEMKQDTSDSVCYKNILPYYPLHEARELPVKNDGKCKVLNETYLTEKCNKAISKY